jgi:hypothetical protein
MGELDLFTDRSSVDSTAILKKLDELDATIPEEILLPHGVPRHALGKLISRVDRLRLRLERFAREIDPTTHHDVYDPSHPEAAADLIARKVLEQTPRNLAELTPFWGAGVYALYYSGLHPAYSSISGREIPIYVGKADPTISHAVTAKQQGPTLFTRLKEHRRSIREAERYADSHPEVEWLQPVREAEFQCRYLVLAGAYSGAVEAALIRHWEPVWNKEMRVCIGFGKHGDRAETRGNTRSDWDTLHPGRPWATREGNFQNRRSPAEIQADIIAHLEHYPPPELIP